MGGKGKKRREKNYLKSHGGDNRLPPPPKPSSIDALPSKLVKLLSFTNNFGAEVKAENTAQKKSKPIDASRNKPQSSAQCESESTGIVYEVKSSTMPQPVDEVAENVHSDSKEDNKQKKRKRKQVTDLRFEAELEKLGGVSKRKQRKREFLKAKKKKQKKGSTEEILDLPKRDEVKFGEVVQAPPKLPAIPKANKKRVDASQERLRLQAIEAYRNRKGWTNRPGIQLPSLSTSDLE